MPAAPGAGAWRRAGLGGAGRRERLAGRQDERRAQRPAAGVEITRAPYLAPGVIGLRRATAAPVTLVDGLPGASPALPPVLQREEA